MALRNYNHISDADLKEITDRKAGRGEELSEQQLQALKVRKMKVPKVKVKEVTDEKAN